MKCKVHRVQKPRHIQKYVEVTSTARRVSDCNSPAQRINQKPQLEMDVRPMFLFYKELRHSYMIAKQFDANHITCIYSTCYSCQLLQLRFLGLISVSLVRWSIIFCYMKFLIMRGKTLQIHVILLYFKSVHRCERPVIMFCRA